MSYDITLAKRPNKVVYKDGDTVLKIFNEDFSKSDVLNEAPVLRKQGFTSRKCLK